MVVPPVSFVTGSGPSLGLKLSTRVGSSTAVSRKEGRNLAPSVWGESVF
jgi:hypothetical protein